MQQMTASICNSAAVGAYKELIDTRESDNTKNRYIIQKFNDNRCWMTQNLRLTNKTITSADSNIASGSFTIPASTTGTTGLGWGMINDTETDDIYGPHAYLNTDVNGAPTGYYNWYTATAGVGDAIMQPLPLSISRIGALVMQ